MARAGAVVALVVLAFLVTTTGNSTTNDPKVYSVGISRLLPRRLSVFSRELTHCMFVLCACECDLLLLLAQPRPTPCAALNTDHGVSTRWGARRIRTAPATLGARNGAAAASASFAAATTSATVTAESLISCPQACVGLYRTSTMATGTRCLGPLSFLSFLSVCI